MDHLIRAARITDVDRLVALWHEALAPHGGSGSGVSSYPLRQLLADDARRDVERFSTAPIEELPRSTRNKGCTVVEAALPDDPHERNRWERVGFSDGVPRMERSVAAGRTAARQS